MRLPALRRTAIALPTAVLLAGGLVGCTGTSEDPVPPAPTETPLAEVDLSGVAVAREPFCDALDPDAVADVLGGAPRSTDAYESGDTRRLAPGLRDVVHEHGCTFDRGRSRAAAWVFAQPVTAAQARALVRERKDVRGCAPAGDLRFGTPGSVLACVGKVRGRAVRRTSLAGLFGDAWLTCEVTRPTASEGAGPDRVARESAQRWCASVATAAAL